MDHTRISAAKVTAKPTANSTAKLKPLGAGPYYLSLDDYGPIDKTKKKRETELLSRFRTRFTPSAPDHTDSWRLRLGRLCRWVFGDSETPLETSEARDRSNSTTGTRAGDVDQRYPEEPLERDRTITQNEGYTPEDARSDTQGFQETFKSQHGGIYALRMFPAAAIIAQGLPTMTPACSPKSAEKPPPDALHSVSDQVTVRETLDMPSDSEGCPSSDIFSTFSAETPPVESSLSALSLAASPELELNGTPSQEHSDTGDSMSDVTDHTDISLIDAFDTAATVSDPLFLSLFQTLRDEIVCRIKRKLQSFSTSDDAMQTRTHQPGVASNQGRKGTSQAGTPVGNRSNVGSSGSPSKLVVRLPGDNDSPGGDGDDGGDGNLPANHLLKTQITQDLKKFACPFYKMYPNHGGLSKSCHGPGWATVHRVKEHIYRRHQRPIFRCTRCLVFFQTDEELSEHLRGEVRCENRTRPPDEESLFITPSQTQTLRKRKKEVSEVDRWNNVFRILFPTVPDEEFPSPYCELYRDIRRLDPLLVNDFREFLAQQLPPRISADLSSHLRVQSVEHGFTGDITELLRSTIREVLEEFLPPLVASSNQEVNNSSNSTDQMVAEAPLLGDIAQRGGTVSALNTSTSGHQNMLRPDTGSLPAEEQTSSGVWDQPDQSIFPTFDFDFAPQHLTSHGEQTIIGQDDTLEAGSASWIMADFSEFDAILASEAK